MPPRSEAANRRKKPGGYGNRKPSAGDFVCRPLGPGGRYGTGLSKYPAAPEPSVVPAASFPRQGPFKGCSKFAAPRTRATLVPSASLPARSLPCLVHAALVAAKPDFVPDPLPLFPPSERARAGATELRGQVLFLYAFHGCVDGVPGANEPGGLTSRRPPINAPAGKW